MEAVGGDNVVDMSIPGGVSGCSRWNPTKEQIDMLEGLYKQGIRTPTAEQIQQITNRLRAFGHIEGKNVFYWFQNHKARQRQKQKQDAISYFNRFIHHNNNSVFSPPPNVVCSPFCIPYTDLALSPRHLHQQANKLLIPTTFKRRSPPATTEKMAVAAADSCEHQTLDLFPLKPSGDLQARTSTSSSSSSSSKGDFGNMTTMPENSSTEGGGGGGSSGHLFFDFFSSCGNGTCESH